LSQLLFSISFHIYFAFFQHFSIFLSNFKQTALLF
jgi:hypothetical protein